jgi:outer membrane protein OmpA-like peptidoglycan-associated protein/tetratricopeptide (TPR) repeat protein
MKTKQFMVLALLSLLLINANYSQDYIFSSKNKKALKYYQAAEIAYKLRELKEAENSLQQAVNADPKFIEAWLLLGDISTELKKTGDAVDAYQKAISLDADFFPPVYYFLGNLYFNGGEYQEAVKEYEYFLQFENITENQKALAGIGLKKSKLAYSERINPRSSMPKNQGESINTEADEYINFVTEDLEKLIFTRKSIIQNDASENPLFQESIFSSEKSGLDWKLAEEIQLSWKDELDIGGMNISVDGRKMYFTGCNWPSGFGSCDILVSYKTGSIWKDPFNLGVEVNSQYWDSQPAISSEGRKIYFASKRAGGIGGSDIWMSIRLSSGKWSKPVNLGDSINSAGDEMAPHIHADGKTLYFSSNSLPGLGGYDLFFSRQDQAGRWTKAENLGYPINTNADEINIFLSIDGHTGWISSNRKGGKGGFDIYSFPAYDSMQPQPAFYVKGVVTDSNTGKKLSAKVEIYNLFKGLVDDSVQSDPVNGEFLLVLHPGINYAFNISKRGYLFYSENYNMNDSSRGSSVFKEFKLSPIQSGNFLVLNNIFFDFNSSVLKPSSFNELKKLIDLLIVNSDLNILIEGHTDNIGSEEYNNQLSAERARSVYEYLISNGIAPSRLKYEGFGASQPIDTNETEEGRNKNRRTEIVII